MSTLVFGQKGDVFVGVDIGYTYADIIKRPFVDRSISPLASPPNLYDDERSFMISVLGEYYFANSWGIRSKIQYYQTAQVSVEPLGTFVDVTGGNTILSFEEFNADRYERNSLSVPVQLMFAFGKGKLRGQAALGPMYSFVLSDNVQQDVFSTGDATNLGYAFNVILSYAVVTDTTFVYLDSSYLNSGEFRGESIKNRAISLGIKYKL
ncbi:hypothetical protein GCM10011344_29180 [Dokdonia pacifica]|nr:hypothetical protein GCM10011344_29180 [Dokdonia pacifica]